MEYFQDDLYPDTRVTWEPALTAQQWLSGEDTRPRYISLRPAGMKLCKCLLPVTGGVCVRIGLCRVGRWASCIRAVEQAWCG